MKRVAVMALSLSVSVAAAACGDGPASTSSVASTVVVADAPEVAALVATADGGFLFGERVSGRVRSVDAAGVLQAESVATIEVRTDGQRGLLGLAVDASDRVFAAWTRLDGRLVVAQIAPGAARAVWDGPQSANLANGGHVAFDPSGRLLIGVGDLQRPKLIDDGTEDRYADSHVPIMDPFSRRRSRRPPRRSTRAT